jgi:ureidoglycolate hydrolase
MVLFWTEVGQEIKFDKQVWHYTFVMVKVEVRF